jgi:hypothetical protein
MVFYQNHKTNVAFPYQQAGSDSEDMLIRVLIAMWRPCKNV